MEESAIYSVVASGEILEGFNLVEVQSDFAELLKISREKSDSIVGNKTVIKNNLNLETAKAYRRKLESIGLAIILKKKTTAAPTKPSFSLALEPTEEELNTKTKFNENEQIPSSAPTENVDCPKCHLNQPKTEQCIGCGVYLHKFITTNKKFSADRTDEEAAQQTTESDEAEEELLEGDIFGSKSLAAAVVAAIVGALLWKFIAVAFDYELGLVAWLIGGAIGFAAAMFGSRGQLAGIACGMLTVIAILGGKYMAMASFQAEWSNTVMEQFDNEEFKSIYAEELALSKLYVDEVTDEPSLRYFMVGYGYTNFSEVDEITQEELSDFNENMAPQLENNANNAPTFEQWLEASFQNQIESLSTWQLMEESLGIIDIVFLLLGVATAYRLGARQ